MNDRPSEPVPVADISTPDDVVAGDPDPDSPALQFPDERPTGRDLVVVEKSDAADGWFTRFLIRIGLRSSGTLRDDLNQALAGEGEAGDVFSPEERAMLQNILRLRELRVEDVMVPRAEVHAVEFNSSLGDILQEFEETGHSRLPVYDDTLDDPRGMVLIKDLLVYIAKVSAMPNNRSKQKNGTGKRELDLARVDLSTPLRKLDVMRKVLFVPPSMLAADLMARMQATRTQMALVIDEYGGTDGLVSLEDIVEEVVGEIEDEHDEENADNLIAKDSEGVWTADARIELDTVADEIGHAFDPGDHADDMDTLGGLVFSLAGHVPVRGEVVTGLPGFEFRVLDADPRRIRRVRIVQMSRRKAGVSAKATTH